MAKVVFPETLRQMLGCSAVLVVDAVTVQEAISELLRQYPAAKGLFMDESGIGRWGGIILYLNGVQIDVARGGLDIEIFDGDELFILMPISGG
ncbi:MoaD/ThiS family protein [Planctomycetota bacterium]